MLQLKYGAPYKVYSEAGESLVSATGSSNAIVCHEGKEPAIFRILQHSPTSNKEYVEHRDEVTFTMSYEFADFPVKISNGRLKSNVSESAVFTLGY